MAVDPESLRRLSLISSEGFNPEADEFHEKLGLEEEDFQFLTDLVEQIDEDAKNLWEAFRETYEVSRYSNDEVVRAFMMFHLGLIKGKDVTVKTFEIMDFISNISGKEEFNKGYKQGFADGFKSGFDEGLQMGKAITKKVKNKKAQP